MGMDGLDCALTQQSKADVVRRFFELLAQGFLRSSNPPTMPLLHPIISMPAPHRPLAHPGRSRDPTVEPHNANSISTLLSIARSIARSIPQSPACLCLATDPHVHALMCQEHA